MENALYNYRAVWERKPVLRMVYNDFFERIWAECVRGPTVEVGGGSGNLKSKFHDIIATDIQFASWLDLIADAQQLPFADGSIGNIVMVDVLHHIEFPVIFLTEAARVLRAGGRIVMVEPAITAGSTLFYRFLHEEPVDMSVDPLVVGWPDGERDPYDSNQALPTLLASRHLDRFHAAFLDFRIAQVQWFSFFVYPLSGGFKSWSLINARVARIGLRLERLLEPLLGRWVGFRMLLVIEKREREALHIVERDDGAER